MATSSIAPPLLRPSMLLISICTVALGLTACETDSTEAVSVQADSIQSASVQSDSVPSNSGQTITENITSSSDSSVTLNRSASAMSMRAMPTSQYLVGSGKADITGAAAETGMFGYASGQVVQGINDRLYSHAFIIGEDTNSQNQGKRVVYVSADMGAMFTAVKLEVIKRLKADYGELYNDDNVMLTATHTHVGNAGYSHQQLYQIASTDDTL